MTRSDVEKRLADDKLAMINAVTQHQLQGRDNNQPQKRVAELLLESLLLFCREISACVLADAC